MQFTSEKRLDDGVVEREFTLGEIPGILWTPESASAPTPLILLGNPGGLGLKKMYPRLVARAQHSAAQGYAAATIELPWTGDRPRSVDGPAALHWHPMPKPSPIARGPEPRKRAARQVPTSPFRDPSGSYGARALIQGRPKNA